MGAPLTVRHGDLVIDLANYRVLLREEPLILTYREYALLVYLAARVGHVVSRRRLLEEGMGRHDVGGLRMVDEHIRRIKSKLERNGRVWIEAADGAEGASYRFIAQ